MKFSHYIVLLFLEYIASYNQYLSTYCVQRTVVDGRVDTRTRRQAWLGSITTS